jgi:glycosyltransferase involved in cell wall biosynthesis
MMRILVDASEAYKNNTGIGRFARNICENLEQLQSDEIEICFAPKDYAVKKAGLARRTLFMLAFNFLKKIFWKNVSLVFLVVFRKCDILLVLDPVVPMIRPRPCVITVHDLIFMRKFAAKEPPISKYWRKMVPISINFASGIIAVSNYTKNDIINSFGTKQEKIKVIYESADSRFQKTTDQNVIRRVIKKYSLPDKFILFVGSIEPRRNIKTLIQSFYLLRTRIDFDIKLIIVGKKGDYFKQISQYIDDMSIKSDIIFLDYVPDEDIPVLYSLALIYVYPTLSEGFGLTPLEAMACGCPVITTNITSIPEVVGDASILIDNPLNLEGLFDAMNQLIFDKSLRQDMIEKGYNNVKNFSWQKAAEELLEAVKAIKSGVNQGHSRDDRI